MAYLIRFAGLTGRKFLAYSNYILSLSALLYRILKIFVTGNYKGKKLVWVGIIEQIYFTAVQALWIIIPIALMIGTAFFLQFSQLAAKYDFGKIAVVALMRETGPMVAAIVVILRSATAVTVEIGYMNVRNEMDAVRMAGADPVALICIPRLAGISAAVLCLFIVFNIVAVLGGYIGAWALSDISLVRFLAMIGKAVSVNDILAVVVKALSFGAIISVVCMYRGFAAKKTITLVPVMVSRASVECFFFCLFVNILISVMFSVSG